MAAIRSAAAIREGESLDLGGGCDHHSPLSFYDSSRGPGLGFPVAFSYPTPAEDPLQSS